MADCSHFDNYKSSYLSNGLADHHEIGYYDAYMWVVFLVW